MYISYKLHICQRLACHITRHSVKYIYVSDKRNKISYCTIKLSYIPLKISNVTFKIFYKVSKIYDKISKISESIRYILIIISNITWHPIYYIRYLI